MQLLANHEFYLPLPQGTFRKLLTRNPMEAAPASMAGPSVVCHKAYLIRWTILEVTMEEATSVALLQMEK